MKVSVTIVDVRLKSNSKINQTLFFTEKSPFCTIFGFTRSHSYPLGDIEEFYQLIAGSFKSDRPINVTGIDKIHLKCDCIQGSIVNGAREPILYSFAFSSPLGHKIYKEPSVKLFEKVNKSVLSHITFYSEDVDHNLVDFNDETIDFNRQLVKIQYSSLYKFQMSLNMTRPKNETKDLLLSITKNCETLIQRTHRKAEGTLEFKMTRLRETFRFNPPIQTQGSWMIGLTSLQVYNFIFHITEENNKFELYRGTNKFGFLELKDELEEIPNISHITQEHLEDEMIGPRIFDGIINLSTEKKKVMVI